jgi:hypothetical protein
MADGQNVPGRFKAADRQWQLTFVSESGSRTVAATGLLQWGDPIEPGSKPLVVLADGGLLAAELIEANPKQITVESDFFGQVRLPAALVAGVVLRGSADPIRQDELIDRMLAATSTDRLLLANGDEVSGTLQAVREGAVQWQADVGPLRVETARITALVLSAGHPHDVPPPAFRVWVGLRDGSRLQAHRLELDPSQLQITLGEQVLLQTAEKNIVTWLQPLGGQAVYLSDLPPAGYRHIPYLALKWPYRTDRNVTGSRLRCKGRLYLKGLGLHSAARLTYLLAEPYRRFEAELAIDDVTAGGGSVRFRVFVDGQFDRPRYVSEVIRGGQPPVPVSIDIRGATRLDLVVDYADRADVLDHADWLDARVVK